MKQVRVGYQMQESTQMGPVVNEKQRQRVLNYLDKGVKEGARMIVEGGAADVPGKAGHYVKPALMEGSLDNVAAREEIFGPVAYLAKFDSEDEALDDGELDRLRPGQQRVVERPGPLWPDRRADARRAIRGSTPTMCSRTACPTAASARSGLGGGVNSPETLFDYWRSVSVVRPL